LETEQHNPTNTQLHKADGNNFKLFYRLEWGLRLAVVTMNIVFSEVWCIGTDISEDGGTFRMEVSSRMKLSLTQRGWKQHVPPKWWCLSINTFTITIVVALRTYMKSI